MTTASSQQPTVKNCEWIPGAEVGWSLGKEGAGALPQEARAGDWVPENGGLRKRGPGLLGLREEGPGSPYPCLGPKPPPSLQEIHSPPGRSQSAE